MSYKINLGAWGSVFAVPSALVDAHLKIASESQLKVLLYILRNGDNDNTTNSISKAISVHPDEVDNAVAFWIDRGLIVSNDGTLLVKQENEIIDEDTKIDDTAQTPVSRQHKPRAKSRPQRPDHLFVARRLNKDSELAGLMEEAQLALSKPLSSGDTAMLVMLHDTDGLPCDVLALLINYCVSVGKGNMRYIERTGIDWAEEGILTVQLAEEKIEQLSRSSNAWSKVSKLFGIRNIGSPTKNQLELADCWINKWKFSDEMLREAYERCVNSKGEYNIRYINAILAKWFDKGFCTIDDLNTAEDDAKKAKSKKKRSNKSVDTPASYDLDSYENYSLFDD